MIRKLPTLTLLAAALVACTQSALNVAKKSWQKHLLDGCEHAALWNICIRAKVDIGNLDMEYNHLTETEMLARGQAALNRDPLRTVLVASSTTAALGKFHSSLLPRIKQLQGIKGIIMVIMGDSTRHDKRPFISDPFVKHIFAINLEDVHPKIEPIPLGMDFHGLLRTSRNGMPPMHWYDQWQELETIKHSDLPRKHLLLRCYNSNTHHERHETDRNVPRHPLVIDCRKHPTRTGFWNLTRQSKFVLSPRGSGIDCHRTWEALYLGAAVITKRRNIPLEQLYAPEPTLLLDEWTQLRNLTVLRAAESNLQPVTLASDAMIETGFWLERFERERFRWERLLQS